MQTLEAEAHDTDEQAEEIKLWDSDDKAIHFALSWTIEAKTARSLIVFLRS